jgi:hypothetical protein
VLQALQIAAWGLKIAGEELQHQVLAELVELPETADPSGLGGANPPTVITPSGDGYRTIQVKS